MSEYFEITCRHSHLIDIGSSHGDSGDDRGEQDDEPYDNEHVFPASR
ncbi:hypothetical protein [Nocardia higoensis]|nr:hypothetical protein [Nocardia higoensis]